MEKKKSNRMVWADLALSLGGAAVLIQHSGGNVIALLAVAYFAMRPLLFR